MKNIETIIAKNIKRFSLLQLIRLLNLKHDNIHHVIKKMHISPNLTLACTKCDFEDIEFTQESYNITSNFLCLYGTSSVLPTFYTEELIFQEQSDNKTLTSFYNIFNRRAYQLLIEILIKNRLMLSLLELKDQEAADFIYSFIGLNRMNIANVKYLKSFKLLRYINIINNQVKSVNALETFLNDLFNISFKVKEMVKVKVAIHKEQLNRLGKANSHIGNCYLGDKIKTITSTFRLVLQELTHEEFNAFLPGEKQFSMLLEAIKLFFENAGYSYILDYSLKDSVKKSTRSILGKRSHCRLGMSTYLGKRKQNYIYNEHYLLLQ